MAKESKAKDVAWWIAILVGAGLTVFPEPATTATGLAILTGAFLTSNGKK